MHAQLLTLLVLSQALLGSHASGRGGLGIASGRGLLQLATAKNQKDFYASLGSNYELLDQVSNVVAVHMVQLPGSDSVLMMERPSGYHPDGAVSIAGTFNLVTRKWTFVDSPDGLFCSGHTLTADGKVVVVGGHQENAGWPSGLQSVRTFDNQGPALALHKVGIMAYSRWYPTATLLPDRTIMIMGGTQAVGAGAKGCPDYEVWNLETLTKVVIPVDVIYMNRVKQNYYPFNYVMPNGDLFNFCGRYGTIMDPYTGIHYTDIPKRFGYATAQYPFTGTSVMLALLPENNYTVEVVVFGGASEDAVSDLTKAAGSQSHRMLVALPNAGNAVYSFGAGWSQEEMGLPRVMGDSTILPNGLVILLSGAGTGLAGDSASGGDSRANYPTFYAQQYDPYAPKGGRYTTLARSQIARMYHSTAVLTTNGTILVAGCDRCNPLLLKSDLSFSAPQYKAEYRMEIFYPPFWYDFANKPKIVSSPTTVTYGQQFLVSFVGETNDTGTVTYAVLVAPSATTHSFNQNQRVVGLSILSNDPVAQILELQAPPTVNHAPPQKYMLFLLNGRTYSRATWMLLE